MRCSSGTRNQPTCSSRRCLKGFKRELPKVTDIKGGRALGIYGNKLTTDHISPVAPIRKGTLAG